MPQHPDPATDAALTWAGRLALSLTTITRADLQQAWESDAGREHRAILKQNSPEILRQLADHVRERAIALKEAA